MNMKYESDMTPKEKREREREQLKQMTFGQKWDHIWTYHKSLFVVPLILACIISIGMTMYRNSLNNQVLSVAVLGGESLSTKGIEELEEEIKDCLQADGKYDTVLIQPNISQDMNDPSANMSLVTLVAAKSLDVLVCPEEVYEDYKEQEAFEPGVMVYKNEGAIQEKFCVRYDDVYIGVLSNSEQKENAQKFMEYLRKNAGQEPKVLE